MPSQSTVGKNKRKMRIRKKTTKRIDVLSISPDKSSSTNLKKRKTAEVSSDDLGPITWGTENRDSESVIPQECAFMNQFIIRKTDIEKELQSLLIVTKNRQHESSVSLYQDSNSSINGVESDISLTQQIHSLQESANSIIISDMTLPSVTEKSPSVKCMTFVEGNEKEGSGFDSMLDSSLLEEVNRIEEETKNEVLNDSDLLSLAESYCFIHN